jgi:hypothetical protein
MTKFSASNVRSRQVDLERTAGLGCTKDRVLISAPHDFGAQFENGGHLFIYKRSGNALSLEEQLSGHKHPDGFGWDFSVSGRTLLVGEPFYRTQPESPDGFAYVYQLPP